ncbi:MAG: ComF family protein [Candidatus Omnitrophica bacterium]|nr:ComF family protein [Candidatus Omnitrophota bacterium]
MLKTLLRGTVDLIFPLNCALCGHFDPVTAEQPLCRTCLEKIPYNHPPFCLKCSRNVKNYNEQGLCPDCLEQLPAFDEAWVFTRYEPPMDALIRSFKFHNKTSLRKTFKHIADTFIRRYSLRLSADMLIPVPIHPARLRERTYNQSELLAESLGELTRLPVNSTLLTKTLFIPRQSDLRRKERWTNIQGAFKIENPSAVTNKSFILVDDLLTTGATASEAAIVLKRAGAASVKLVVLSAAKHKNANTA